MIRNFIVCSSCAGLVGVLEAMRTSSVHARPRRAPTRSCFDAISAAVIGGTLLAGGAGTVVGALFGALFLGILRDGLIIKGVNADYLTSILGLAILVAMVINIYVGRVRRGPALADTLPASTSSRRPRRPTTSCASRTSPSASAR